MLTYALEAYAAVWPYTARSARSKRVLTYTDVCSGSIRCRMALHRALGRSKRMLTYADVCSDTLWKNTLPYGLTPRARTQQAYADVC